MSQELTVSKEQQLLDKIRSDDFRTQLKAALPPSMSVGRFERVTVTAISNNPALIAVDRRSLYNAILKCAQDGLLPDGREAALLDVNDRKAQGGKAARYMPMVAGYRRIAANHHISLEAFVVFENDRFEYEFGLDPKLIHVPGPFENRGEPVAAYAIGRRTDGERWFDVMEKAEIEAVRESSKAATSEYGPWVKAWTEMARKTVARRLFKSLPFPNGLSERETALLEAGDSDVEFTDPEMMTKGHAELHASVGAAVPPGDVGPDDDIQWPGDPIPGEVPTEKEQGE